jgi:RNA polymerase subunit RPABC4/transcription elongation factor Spt4
MILDSPLISNLTLIAAGYGAAFLVALWVSLIIWTFRDIRQRTRDPLLRILAVLVVAILFLPGLLIYAILRPSRTVEEEYQKSLEEEALLQTIEDTPQCPGCNRSIQPDWQVCPNCHTRLKKTCQECGKLMELAWDLCPYCGTPTPGLRKESISMDEALQQLPHESAELDLGSDFFTDPPASPDSAARDDEEDQGTLPEDPIY